ncbi:folate-binding protein YgfZ [Brevirhabdus pacifica]|uniref:Folate-binding protein YgfZ n=1 Tax=Brevirhabdus pacifica TaxID=1267768 RepID=A0A1U7DHG8_9RHOB|nr:folate-binding protein YgfZ [Brevirhabdus pacifica]APX89333.1 folate-binding protein YgfZ [Brevirhabdus pacifica]OWU76641.1 aminomethyltransferase [Loktanella sp. 22II-4b]PJJ86043.1 hypothetical protein CLV77_0576 [Brevirhabdus pacifica]
MPQSLDAPRTILAITGGDRIDFLQNLVTNNVTGAPGLVYAALLSPQGKYLCEFFLKTEEDRVLLDAPALAAPDLFRRLSLYKLRADVQISESELHLHRGTGPAPDDAQPDPRHPAMGWRAYREAAPEAPGFVDWDALRVEHGIPAHGAELLPDESFILEMGFERLNGVDFRKGCYVGQEVTARMKHKTELRKGLVRVAVEPGAENGPESGIETGAEILALTDAGTRPAGHLGTVAGDRALAYLRHDRAGGEMRAGEAKVSMLERLGG